LAHCIELRERQEAFLAQTGFKEDIANAPPFAFLECVYEADKIMAMEQWHTASKGERVTFEIRWNKTPCKQQGTEDETRDYLWTLTACVPIRSEDGAVTGIFGCNTEISCQKEATRMALLRMEAERRLANFTELAPIACYQSNADLEIEYCNDQWYQITDHPRVPMEEICWRSIVLEEDLEGIYRDAQTVWQTHRPHTFYFRLKKLWTGPDGISTPTWILATATTRVDWQGRMISMGIMTDISQLKWAESIQRIRVEEALESKRQQENFIDMTSHEMRNPLSAMVQCADLISSSLSEMAVLKSEYSPAAQVAIKAKLKDLINISLDAVDTIQSCATHQKRIVDDILTLSKLDSKLLTICPIMIRPVALLQDVHKMFKEEARKASVDLQVRCDGSIEAMDIDFAILDPSRVLQVLINLLTNAIKFTRTQHTRKIEVIMSASLKPEEQPEVDYVPQKYSRNEFLDQREWGEGKIFYLHFTVRDTGCGLTAEHKDKLFQRFSQATPRTHVQVCLYCPFVCTV
jgi:signal transduction histidine kinase